jgi:hypothetical protein
MGCPPSGVPSPPRARGRRVGRRGRRPPFGAPSSSTRAITDVLKPRQPDASAVRPSPSTSRARVSALLVVVASRNARRTPRASSANARRSVAAVASNSDTGRRRPRIASRAARGSRRRMTNATSAAIARASSMRIRPVRTSSAIGSAASGSRTVASKTDGSKAPPRIHGASRSRRCRTPIRR